MPDLQVFPLWRPTTERNPNPRVGGSSPSSGITAFRRFSALAGLYEVGCWCATSTEPSETPRSCALRRDHEPRHGPVAQVRRPPRPARSTIAKHIFVASDSYAWAAAP